MSYYSIATRAQKCRRYLRGVGLDLRKSPIRDEWADTYGMYAIVKSKSGLTDCQYDLDLDEVEDIVKHVVLPELLEKSRH